MKNFIQQKVIIPIIYRIAYFVGTVHGIIDTILGTVKRNK